MYLPNVALPTHTALEEYTWASISPIILRISHNFNPSQFSPLSILESEQSI